MFDVGFAELFLLSLIGLLVLGPERLPAVARTLGGFVRKARLSYYNLKRTVEAELAAAEAANPIKEAQKELESVKQEVQALGDKLSEDHAPALTPTAADPHPALENATDAPAQAEPPSPTPGDAEEPEPEPRPRQDSESMTDRPESEVPEKTP